MKRLIAILLMVLLCAGCIKITVLQHDEKMAAQSAEEFAKIALIDTNFQKAYPFITKNTSIDMFISIIKNLHPQGYPSQVKAIEYEPIPGQQGINIFLEGHNSNETFYYRFLMEGTKNQGYKVAGLWRSNGPYPSSELRKSLTGGDRD